LIARLLKLRLRHFQTTKDAGGCFFGQSVDQTSILVRYTWLGDANLDRSVDVADLGILASNWQQSPRVFSQGDFNYDGVVDISDLGMLATSWQKSLPVLQSRGTINTPRERMVDDVLASAGTV
jgi:hypothetical protein